jgi:hypothetical protein
MTERTEGGTSAQQGPGEVVEMAPEERAKRLTALWKRLIDPDGFDRDALATIEAGPTAISDRPATL